MEHLRGSLDEIRRRRFDTLEVEASDDFSYRDPVDGSVSSHQGVRILLSGGSRVVFRLSGTGTKGATLRVYLERYEPDPRRQDRDPQEALRPIIAIAEEVAQIRARLGREAPTVIT